jgi:phosphohistidine phosphatase
MEIYLLRHGQAEDRAPGRHDADRKLTAKGRRDVRAVLTLAKPDLQAILTSGLRRADESAAIAAQLYPGRPVTTTQSLIPTADPAAIWTELRAGKLDRLLLAGHQPHLGSLISFLLGSPLSLDLKKGALVRIDIEPSDPPHGTLKWIVTPRLANRGS